MEEAALTTNQINIFFTVIMLLSLWELVWKGFALWRAGRLNDKGWFIAILIFNTVGILPMVYLFIVSKGKDTAKKTTTDK